MINYVKLNEAPILDSAPENAHVLLEDNGLVKRVAPDKIGSVKTVNGVEPDEEGNVQVEIPDDCVKTVNGVEPDEEGNVEIQIPDDCVKTVNGVQPDEEGNVEIDIPEGFSGEWDDLKGKPFYEESGENTLIEGNNVSFAHYNDENNMLYRYRYACELSEPIVPGESYHLYLKFGGKVIDDIVTASEDGIGESWIAEDGYNTREDVYGSYEWKYFIPAGSTSVNVYWLLSQMQTAGHSTVTVNVVKLVHQYNRVEPLPDRFLPTTVPVIQTAQVGQTVVVKAVDENGKPTEWEAADVSGGSGGVPMAIVYGVLRSESGWYENDTVFVSGMSWEQVKDCIENHEPFLMFEQYTDLNGLVYFAPVKWVKIENGTIRIETKFTELNSFSFIWESESNGKIVIGGA